jgi:hypothetical protein
VVLLASVQFRVTVYEVVRSGGSVLAQCIACSLVAFSAVQLT